MAKKSEKLKIPINKEFPFSLTKTNLIPLYIGSKTIPFEVYDAISYAYEIWYFQTKYDEYKIKLVRNRVRHLNEINAAPISANKKYNLIPKDLIKIDPMKTNIFHCNIKTPSDLLSRDVFCVFYDFLLNEERKKLTDIIAYFDIFDNMRIEFDYELDRFNEDTLEPIHHDIQMNILNEFVKEFSSKETLINFDWNDIIHSFFNIPTKNEVESILGQNPQWNDINALKVKNDLGLKNNLGYLDDKKFRKHVFDSFRSFITDSLNKIKAIIKDSIDKYLEHRVSLDIDIQIDYNIDKYGDILIEEDFYNFIKHIYNNTDTNTRIFEDYNKSPIKIKLTHIDIYVKVRGKMELEKYRYKPNSIKKLDFIGRISKLNRVKDKNRYFDLDFKTYNLLIKPQEKILENMISSLLMRFIEYKYYELYDFINKGKSESTEFITLLARNGLLTSSNDFDRMKFETEFKRYIRDNKPAVLNDMITDYNKIISKPEYKHLFIKDLNNPKIVSEELLKNNKLVPISEFDIVETDTIIKTPTNRIDVKRYEVELEIWLLVNLTVSFSYDYEKLHDYIQNPENIKLDTKEDENKAVKNLDKLEDASRVIQGDWKKLRPTIKLVPVNEVIDYKELSSQFSSLSQSGQMELQSAYQNFLSNFSSGVPVVIKTIPIKSKESEEEIAQLIIKSLDAKSHDPVLISIGKNFIKSVQKFFVKLGKKLFRFSINILTLGLYQLFMKRYTSKQWNDSIKEEILNRDDEHKPALVLSIDQFSDVDWELDINRLNLFFKYGWGNIFIIDDYNERLICIMRLGFGSNKYDGYVTIIPYSGLRLIRKMRNDKNEMYELESGLDKITKNIKLEPKYATKLVHKSLMKKFSK